MLPSAYLIKVLLRCFTLQVVLTIFPIGGGLLNPHIQSPSDLFSFSHIRNAARLDDSLLVALRTVSSSTRGMKGTVDEQLHTTNVTSEEVPDKPASHPRIGIGLPMSNIYAK